MLNAVCRYSVYYYNIKLCIFLFPFERNNRSKDLCWDKMYFPSLIYLELSKQYYCSLTFNIMDRGKISCYTFGKKDVFSSKYGLLITYYTLVTYPG